MSPPRQFKKLHASGLCAEFIKFDGKVLPFSDNQFDIAFACCVFHHIPPNQRLAMTKEMARVVVPGGLIVIFEHNPWNPLTRIVVSRCEFDQDAILLRGKESMNLLKRNGLDKITSHQILYFPWRGKFWKLLEALISWIPLGAQYFVYGCKPRSRDLFQAQ